MESSLWCCPGSHVLAMIAPPLASSARPYPPHKLRRHTGAPAHFASSPPGALYLRQRPTALRVSLRHT
jgi:hypothetical protein